MHGNVTVDNAANINAASGVGIGLYNFGVGNLSATIRPTSTVSAISAGVNAFAQGGGSVSIVNQGVIIANSGAGITVGTGTGTPNSVSGLISINNSGAITSLGSSANPTIQINNASTQAAILTNSGTITANLFGKAASNLAVAAYNGSIAITNTGTISGNVSLASATINNAASGTWRVSGTNFLGSAASITNAGTIAIYGLSYFNAAVLFALANSGTINLQANSTAIVGANVTGAGTFNIGDRSMLELVGSVAAGQTISFTAGGRGVLTLDNPSNFQGSISGLATGDLINLGGVTISSASITATTLTVTKADTTTLTYQVTSVQPNTMLNVLASDKIVVVPTTAVTITGQSTPYSSSPSSAQAYIFANDAIVSPTAATSGININAPLAINPADTIFVNINQTSSVSLPAPASGSGATPAGVDTSSRPAAIEGQSGVSRRGDVGDGHQPRGHDQGDHGVPAHHEAEPSERLLRVDVPRAGCQHGEDAEDPVPLAVLLLHLGQLPVARRTRNAVADHEQVVALRAEAASGLTQVAEAAEASRTSRNAA